MRPITKNLYLLIIAVLSGALMPFAFAPFGIWPLAIVSATLLLFLWTDCSARKAWLVGLFYGFGYFGVGISWVFISIHVYGNTNVFLAGLITALFVFILALFPAFTGMILNYIFRRDNYYKALIGFPIVWVFSEWVRTWIFTGFPWLLVGYSQLNSWLRGYAPIASVYLISLAVMLCAGLIYLIIMRRHYLLFLPLIAIWLVGFALNDIQWTRPEGKPVTASLIQGNVPQLIKWDPDKINGILNTYYGLTKEHWKSKIIVWPESAISISYNSAKPFLDELNSQATFHKSALIVGVPKEIPNTKDGFYNSMMVLGDGKGFYNKRHLVPYGEYLPFDKQLRGLINFFDIPMSSFSKGQLNQPPFIAQNIRLAPFICYEIVYPFLVAHSFPQDNMIITISDDSWFGRSIAAAQHLQMAQMRSLETGRPQIFSTNNGPSALINAQGKILRESPFFEKAVVSGSIQPMQGETPWVWMAR